MKDLMQPRYKVIADYPCAIHSVGDIILTYKSAMSYAVKIDEVSDKICLADYPAIFRQMEWWEERQPEEMPEYLKDRYVPESSEYYKVRKAGYDIKNNSIYLDGMVLTFTGTIHQYLPATEDEYNIYTAQQRSVSRSE